MKSLLHRALLALLALTLWIVAGCGRGTSAEGTSAEGTPAQSTATTTLAWTPDIGAAQIAIANDRQLWSAAGVAPQIVPFPSGRAALEALLAGQAEFAVLAELPAVIGAMRSQKFVVLAVLSRYKGNRLIANAGSGKLDVQWFAGKRIGVTLGTNNQYMTELVLERAGIKAELVNLAPPDMVAALARGDVDAASMFSSYFPAAQRALNTRYAEFAVPEYETTMVLAVSADVAAQRPEVVRKVLAALLKADELIKSDPAAAQRSMAAAVGGAMTVEHVKAAWPDFRIGMTLDQPLLDLMLQEGKWIAARGLVKETEPSEDLFRRYLRADFLKPLAADRVTLKSLP